MTSLGIRPTLLLSLSLLALASCEASRPARVSASLEVQSGVGEEEELIGDTLWGVSSYTQMTDGGWRASYKIVLTAGAARDSMYYMSAPHHQWGWYTTKENPSACDTSAHHREKHDVNGDTFADSVVYGDTVLEHHCLPNGQFTLELRRVAWNPAGTAVVGDTLLFTRRVALLDHLGSYENDPNSTNFHDVRLSFDRLRPEDFAPVGDLRAADYYSPDPVSGLYPPGTAFTIGGGDTLWFQSTYVGAGPDPRPWFGNRRAILTQFNFDYAQAPLNFRAGVNSSPDNEVSPALRAFPLRVGGAYQAVGRVVAPYHLAMDSGLVDLEASIYVTTIALDACFAVSGYRVSGQSLAFDGQCSSGADTLEYSWAFGDGQGADWPVDSAIVHHTYDVADSYLVVLRVRRAGTTAPVDSTTQALEVVGPVWTLMTGQDHISAPGTYTWTAVPHDGAPPYWPYGWYYQQGGSGETQVGFKASYSRYIPSPKEPYAFRLRLTVQDAIPMVAEDTLWVDVVPGGARADELGLVGTTGACDALPAALGARQAAHQAVFRAGRWPEPCLVRVP